MRRITLLLALLLGLTLVPTGAWAGGDTEWQFVSGNIKFLTRFTDADGGWPGLVRRVYNGSAASNGLIGYVINVDPMTQMGRFELEVTREGGEGLPDPFSPADLGIYFYSEFGDAGGQAAPTTTGEYEVRKPGGEIGFIPPETRYAVVFMSRGFDVDFTYRGYTPPTVAIGATGFSPADLEIGSGGWVVFNNTDSDFHGARADDGSFNSSPSDKHPLRPGDSFAVQLLKEKEIPYFDPFGTDASGQPHRGVIRVVAGPGPGTPD